MNPETRRILRETLPFLRPYRRRLGAAFVCLLISTPLAQIHPLVWKYVVDHLLPPGAKLEVTRHGITVLFGALGVMLAAQLLSSGFGAIHGFLLETSGQGLVRDLRNRVYAHLGRQTLAYHRDRRTGDLVARVISDVDAMEGSVLNGLSSLFEEILTFIIVGAIVVSLQPRIGACIFLPLIGCYAFIRAFNKRARPVYERVRARLGEISTFVTDRLGGIQLIQATAREDAEIRAFGLTTQAHYEQNVQAMKLRRWYYPGVGFFGFASSVVMLGLGVYYIWQGQFTLGGLVAYRGYWWRLQSPVLTIARMADTLQRARAAAGRVLGVLREPLDIVDQPGAVPWRDPRGRIEFADVTFSYGPTAPAPGREASAGPLLILDRVSFTIEPGEMVAVAGVSGAGKTTLLNLIPRFYEPQAGRVLLDGRDVRELTLSSVRARVGLVLQDTYLFHESVFENIRYAVPEATREEVARAAQQANAHEFIARLPQGYDTPVGERGVKLSGGQRQRLGLARAFLANPPVLLLDEPTSAVEPESEELIHAALLALSRERTTLLVTHRVSLLRRAARILFFDGGRLVAEGTHDALARSNPEYARAYAGWEAVDAG